MTLWTGDIDLRDHSRGSARRVPLARLRSAEKAIEPQPVRLEPFAAPLIDTDIDTDTSAAHADWRAGRSFTWVTSSGRAIPVRIDTPPFGRIRGAVVIVPSLGRETVVSYRTVRSLAVRAARAGLVALSFSLSGDGDSEDLRPGDDAVQAWTEDVRAVAALAHDLVRGAGSSEDGDALPVSFVGLRLGGALVQRLHDLDGADDSADRARGAYVVWEPVSGVSFLRHHMQLRATGVPGDPVTDGVELDGYLLTQAQASSLRTLPAARRPRANAYPEQALSHGELHIRFEADRRDSVRLALGATYFAHVPLGALDEIVSILPTGDPRAMQTWTPVTQATMQVIDDAGVTHEVLETLVEAGPSRLPAIVTSSPGSHPRHGLTLSAMGAEVKWGPGRVWTRAARVLAPAGVVSIRADRSLIGDDVDPDNAREPNPYTDASVADASSAVKALRDAVVATYGAEVAATLPVATAGVCAGTWSQLRAAADQPIDMVIAVNPVHWNPDATLYTEAFFDHYHGEEAPDLDNPCDASAPAFGEIMNDPKRAASELKSMLSREIAIRFPRIRSAMRPEVPVDKVRYLLDDVIRGTHVHLVFGTEEERIFNGKGGRRAMYRAAHRGVPVRIERLGNLDHSLLSEKARRDTLDLLRRLLVR
ncbi:MAG: hypothetical protein Q4G51_05695 [Dermatophilus congolensis]|nr:hypothetical protein [Dermatophilus congolensis]